MAKEKTVPVMIEWVSPAIGWRVRSASGTVLVNEAPTLKLARTKASNYLALQNKGPVVLQDEVVWPEEVASLFKELQLRIRELDELSRAVPELRFKIANKLIGQYRLTQIEAAAASGVSQGYLNRLISGKTNAGSGEHS